MMLICSSNYAKKYNKGFLDRTMPMLCLYKNFLMEMRSKYKDESRQILCLSSSKCYYHVLE